MTKAQRTKAVAVAQDVLDQMKYMRVRDTKHPSIQRTGGAGAYLKIENASVLAQLQQHVGAPLQKLMHSLLTPKKVCQVCARGALFLSYVNKFNRFKIPLLTDEFPKKYWLNQIPAPDCASNPLTNIFSEQQLTLIESAFECFSFSNVENDILAAQNFGKKYRSAPNRLRAIMQNIIANNGEFKP